MMPNNQNNIVFPPGNSVPNNRLRVRILQLILVFLFVGVILRLIQVQIIESEKYHEMAERQYKSKRPLPAERGTLYDRWGNKLATNITRASFAVDPSLAKDSALSIARTFSRLFGESVKDYLKIIKTDSSRFEWLKRFVDLKYISVIQIKNYRAVRSERESERLYYHDRIAGQLIGTTDIKNNGIAGLEKYFNKDLRGKDGYVILQRDGKRRLFPSVDYPRIEPEHGHNIHLTVDMRIQAIAEKELKKGAEKNKARGGIVVVLQPQTGEILAIAQYPQINPDAFGKFEFKDQNLRAVIDIFEPGSMFKIVTAAAALEYRLVNPTKKFNAENGIYLAPVPHSKPRLIRDIHKAKVYTFEEAMEHSSNIVMAKISDIVGSKRFYQIARNFGFGTKTNVEFPGEDQGVLKKPKNWSATTLNSLAFGYEVSATPLQIACAYAAVANGGKLMKPTILKKVTDVSGNIIRESKPQLIRTVISPSTTEVLTRMLEKVVENGTGTNAQIQGMRIAGKTGTTKKHIDGHYQSDKYIASFAGFFPADNPKIVCLVMIDEPDGSEIYGSTVSAPIFRAIAEQIINTTDILQSTNSLLTTSDQKSAAFPTSAKVNDTTKGVIPNVCGLSIRRAVEILREHKLTPSVTGSGIVTDQIPDAGSQLTGKRVVRLICQPKASATIGYR
jgi:cell division protein FtsI/penicillin-binding protein 2